MNRMFLDQFKNFQINREDLTKKLGKCPIYAKSENPVYVNVEDIKRLLKYYISGELKFEDVIQWCDVIRYSELFEYPDEEKEQEIIATVIDEIQDAEDYGKRLLEDNILRWLSMLCKND